MFKVATYKLWNNPSRCIFIMSAFLVFVLMIFWKFDCTAWDWCLDFSIGQNFSRIFVPVNSEMLTKKEFGSSYSVVEITHPAIAWRPVVYRLLPSTSNGAKIGGSTFWGRATNKMEIAALNIKHVENDIYKAEFTPSFAGLYEVVIFLTYVNGEQFEFYYRHVKSRMVNVTGSPFFVLVQGRPPPGNVTRYCSQAESGTVRGRWVKCGSLTGIERCGEWQLINRYDFDKRHGYFWLPYSCQLHYYTNNEMKICFARNGWEKIVLTGDSHSRFRTYHWATRLYGECRNCSKNQVKTSFDHVPQMEWVFDARGTRWPATFPTTVRRPNEIYIHQKTRRSMFSDGLPNSTKDGQLYIMNFGHWLLRVMTFKKFMSEKLVAFLQGVKLMNHTMSGAKPAKQKRFIWVNTLSLKWREDIYVSNWTMTPSPSMIGYLNSLLDQAMKDAGIQVVDAFQISNPRLSAVCDSTHYAKVFPDGICAGVVENSVTNVILNALCNNDNELRVFS